ncbi:MAG TPA: hypothetical protein PKE32_01860 [Miltoncostaeaceae bacterium]|nr:hypothetical protein [Miltoncostaeaceae bacterium]
MHSLLRRTAGLVALVAAIALISGCGSDSSSLSADELRTQADAACAEAKTALDALAAPTGNDDVLPFLTSGRDITAAAVDKLKKLTPPDDLKGDWERVITLNDEQLAALDSTITKIESKELTPEAALSEFGSAADARTTELRELATKLDRR